MIGIETNCYSEFDLGGKSNSSTYLGLLAEDGNPFLLLEDATTFGNKSLSANFFDQPLMKNVEAKNDIVNEPSLATCIEYNFNSN